MFASPAPAESHIPVCRGGLGTSLALRTEIEAHDVPQVGHRDGAAHRHHDTLGDGEIGYTLQAEINPQLIHKKGVLAAAREGDDINPKFESSACQFYIVQGKVRTPEDLKKAEDRIIEERIRCRFYCFGSFGKTSPFPKAVE